MSMGREHKLLINGQVIGTVRATTLSERKENTMTEKASYTGAMYDLVEVSPKGTYKETQERRGAFKGTKYKLYRAMSAEYRKAYSEGSAHYDDPTFHDANFKDFWYSGNPDALIDTQLPRHMVKGDSTHFTVVQVVPLAFTNDFISRDADIIGDVVPVKSHELSRFTTEQLKSELANREV